MQLLCKASLCTAAFAAAFVTILGLGKCAPTIASEKVATENREDEDLTEEMKHQLTEKFGNDFPSYLTGYDYEGSPVFVFEFGKYKYTTISEDQEEDFIKFFHYLIQAMVHQAAKTCGKDVGYIADFKDFSLEHFNTPRGKRLAIKAFQLMGQISSSLKYGILINENSAAMDLMHTARGFLGDFQHKVEAYGTEKDEWGPKLLKKVPKDQLAPEYGGVPDFKPVEFHG